MIIVITYWLLGSLYLVHNCHRVMEPQEALSPTTEQNELFYGCHYAEALTALKALKVLILFSCGHEHLLRLFSTIAYNFLTKIMIYVKMFFGLSAIIC